jgi:hypothetical protein
LKHFRSIEERNAAGLPINNGVLFLAVVASVLLLECLSLLDLGDRFPFCLLRSLPLKAAGRLASRERKGD